MHWIDGKQIPDSEAACLALLKRAVTLQEVERIEAFMPIDDKTEADLIEMLRVAKGDKREVLEMRLTHARRKREMDRKMLRVARGDSAAGNARSKAYAHEHGRMFRTERQHDNRKVGETNDA
jgi:hypothetical protein